MSSNTFSSIIEKYFSRNGGWIRIRGELSVYYWPRIAGEELAKKVEAVRFRDGFLYLQTENPALAHQILLMNLDILKKYQLFFGSRTVKGIKIKVGVIKEKTNVAAAVSEKPLLNKEENEVIEKCKNEIANPKLAEKFAKAMQINYQNCKQKKATGGKNCPSCGVVIDIEFNYCPCCEHKVNQEIAAYMAYRKKNKSEVTTDELGTINDLKHLQIGRTQK